MRRFGDPSSESGRRIMDAALDILRNEGFAAVSLAATGRAADCSHSLVAHYYRTTQVLRDAVAREAISREDGAAIGALVAARHPSVEGLDVPRRLACLRLFTGVAA